MRAVALSILFALVGCAPGVIEPDAPLSADVDFEPYPGSQWYDPDGRPVPKESGVINAITGPDHCDWEDGVMLHLGWPPGHDAADASESKQYFRDPERVFPQGSLVGRFDGDVELPEPAEDTGYRTEFMELWLEPEDHSAAYLVFANHTERWPRGKDIACG
jgi:hypothetical protein